MSLQSSSSPPIPPMHQRHNSSNKASRSNSTSTSTTATTTSIDLEGGRGGSRIMNGNYSNSSSRNNSYRNSSYSSNHRNNGHADANASILEQQNDERISMLSDQVSRLKSLTIDIGNEVRGQNATLDQMGDAFANTRHLLQGSLRRIATMFENGGGLKHMCGMVAFCVLVMVLLWFLMKR